jgi:hypothetical protein
MFETSSPVMPNFAASQLIESPGLWLLRPLGCRTDAVTPSIFVTRSPMLYIH